jgi:hypothetical protein
MPVSESERKDFLFWHENQGIARRRRVRTYEEMVRSVQYIIPAKAGIQEYQGFPNALDPGFRRGDD